MRPKALDHVVFIVGDLDDATRTFERLFGLEVAQRVPPGVLQANLALFAPGGAGSASALVELCCPEGEGPLATRLDEEGEGMLSLSVEVDDIDAAVAELQAGGMDVSDVVPGPLPDTRVARFPAEAVHGVRLQLIER